MFLCLVATTSSPPTHVPCKRIRYFHIPKAGSSFAEYVWAWACPSLPLEKRMITLIRGLTSFADLNQGYRAGLCQCSKSYNVSGTSLESEYHHQPMKMEYMVAASAGLFRAPAARIVSAFNYGLHAHGMEPAGRTGATAMKAAVRGASKSRQSQLATYAHWPGVASVSTKMLLGLSPSAVVVLNATDVQMAVSRVSKMAFVGLTECFDESAALFMRVFPGRVYPNHPSHVRDGALNSSRARSSDEALLCSSGFDDVPDATVYRAAMTRFLQDLRAAGLSVQGYSCGAALHEWQLSRTSACPTM